MSATDFLFWFAICRTKCFYDRMKTDKSSMKDKNGYAFAGFRPTGKALLILEAVQQLGLSSHQRWMPNFSPIDGWLRCYVRSERFFCALNSPHFQHVASFL